MLRANRFVPRQHVIQQVHKILKQRKKASNVFRPNQSSTVAQDSNFHPTKRHSTTAGSISGHRNFGSLVSRMKKNSVFASQKAQFRTNTLSIYPSGLNQILFPIKDFKYTPAMISFLKPALTLGTSIHTISTIAANPLPNSPEIVLENLENSQSRIHTMSNSVVTDDSIDILNQCPITPKRQAHGINNKKFHKHSELHITSNDGNLIDVRTRVDDLHSRHHDLHHTISKHETFHDPVSSSQLPRADAALTGLGFDLEDELRLMMRPKGFKQENIIIDKFNAIKGQNPAKDHYRHTWE